MASTDKGLEEIPEGKLLINPQIVYNFTQAAIAER